MSLTEHYAEVRARLRNPPNAVADRGIDLQRERREAIEAAERRKAEIERQKRFDDRCLDFFNWQATVCPEVVRRKKSGDPSFKRILIETAKHCGVSTRDIRSPRRLTSFVRARQIAFWLAKNCTILSYPQIGDLAGRDHTTVLYAVRKIEELRQTDVKLQASLNHLLSVLRPVNPENCNAEDPAAISG